MKKEKKSLKLLKKNPWIISTALLAVVVLVLLFLGNGISGKTISEENAKNLVQGFVDSQVDGAQVTSVSREGNFYKADVSIQGQNVPVYLTLDGKEIVVNVIPLEEVEKAPSNTNTNTQPAQQAQAKTSYSQEELAEVSSTVECLAEKGVKIYGADWCGYTKSFAETLGGFDVIAPIYVECTTETGLCSQEGITGYPTTKINGEPYSGPRTFEGLESATGCVAPKNFQPVQQAPSQPVQQAPEKSSYSQEELVEISSTVECLAEKDVKIYGANWCGYTKSFVGTLGGFDVIDSIYVECTEETELCSQEGITGYPTTKIGGKTYSGPRTFEGLESETGCAAPKIEVQVAPAASASC